MKKTDEQRTFNTLFMLSSLDGKISTGITDKRDFDKDFPKLSGIKEGLNQYYKLEQNTDLFSFNSGKVMAKVGWNNPKKNIQKIPVSFIIIDNTHLSLTCVKNLVRRVKKLFIVTTNKNHPAKKVNGVEIIFYSKKIDFRSLFQMLREEHFIQNITLQSGSTLNSVLLRERLIDRISLVISPVLIGGEDTPSLIGGRSLYSEKDLQKLGLLRLEKITKLKNSYLHVVYDILN